METNQNKKVKFTRSYGQLLVTQQVIQSLSAIDPETKSRRVRMSMALDLSFSRVSTAIKKELEPVEEVRKRQQEDRKKLEEEHSEVIKKLEGQISSLEDTHASELSKLKTAKDKGKARQDFETSKGLLSEGIKNEKAEYEKQVQELDDEWAETMKEEKTIECYGIQERLLSSETTTGPGADVLEMLQDVILFED